MNTGLEKLWTENQAAIRPYRDVMSRFLNWMLAVVMLVLAGMGCVKAGTSIADLSGPLLAVTGEALMLGGAGLALVAMVQLWHGTFNIAGMVGKDR